MAKGFPCNSLVDKASDAELDPTTGLCAVCEQVDMRASTEVECVPVYFLNDDRLHFHIGTHGEIKRKEHCPGCRLVLSVIKSNASELPADQTLVTLSRSLLESWSEEEQPIQSVGNMREMANEDLPHHGEAILDVFLGRSTSGATNYRRLIGSIARTNPRPSKSLCYEGQPCFHIQGHAVPRKIDLRMVRDWKTSCDTEHGATCKASRLTGPQHKVRFIDVQKCCIVSDYLNSDYMALSYVWGAIGRQILTLENEAELSEPGSLQHEWMIPRTISDTIQLVRSLGVRYLWVDSLCVMEHVGDKRRQLPLMGEIYARAQLVVLATAGTDANAGLPGFRIDREEFQSIETIDDMRFLNVGSALQEVLSSTR